MSAEAIFHIETVRAAPGYWYLATPYTRYPAGIEAAFIAASRAAADLVRLGIGVFSPIAHTHPVGVHGGIDPLDLDLWLKVDAPLMNAAHGLIVFKLDSWEESRGVAHEVDVFGRAGKPIEYLSPLQLENAVRIEERRARRV
jgi:hypothetical protein